MAQPTRAPFVLTDQPWILTHYLDGKIRTTSIKKLAADAHEIGTIVGEIPTQTFAIVRLLLAILHRAVDRPLSSAAWHALWRSRSLPVDDVVAYLDHFRDRFDLLHPKAPFYQVADLRTAKDDVFRLDRLIADVPTGERYFTTRLKTGLDRISYAEAARWLVHCQAFDPSGIKSGAVGDRRVKGGRGYPIGTGWSGALGGVFVEGRSLKETLLLHLIPDDFGDLDQEADHDLPVWEREPLTAAEEHEGGREPRGPVDLYTWQSRRIRLFSDEQGVHGVLIANGDKMTPQDRHRKEPMSAWRRSEPQEKKLRRSPVYMPREHRPERAIWRGLGALLPSITDQTQGRDALAPAVLEWINTAQDGGEGALDSSYQVRARAIGMQYGSKQATTTEIIDDAVSMSVVLLKESSRLLGAAVDNAVRDAEAAVQALGNLAGNLAEAAGGEASGPRDQARELGYASLDRPFRSWLANISPETDPLKARRDWQKEAREHISELGRTLVEQSGPAAWVGREARGRHVSTPEADLWFRRRLRKVLELAYQTDETEGPA